MSLRYMDSAVFVPGYVPLEVRGGKFMVCDAIIKGVDTKELLNRCCCGGSVEKVVHGDSDTAFGLTCGFCEEAGIHRGLLVTVS